MTLLIGQTQLKNTVDNLKTFPRFIILVGESGSGKKLMSEWIAEKIGIFQICDSGVDNVRGAIEDAYTKVTPTVYIFQDADNMSVAAKNAMLKVTEEPPNNAYFIMTVLDDSNVLPTIKSRATIFHMNPYSQDELLEYYHRQYRGHDAEILSVCSTPGDVDLLCKYGVKEFYDYVTLVIEHIDKVSGSNSFKIGGKLNLGTDLDKFDLSLFWKAFRAECLNRIKEFPFKYICGVNITSKYLYELRVAGVNKQMCFDNWLLDIREEWFSYADSET